jgi:phenylacetate-CoA ligase
MAKHVDSINRRLFGPISVRTFDLLSRRRIYPTYEWLKRTQWCSVDEIKEIQRSQLRELLIHAWTYSGFYRKRLDVIGWAPGHQTEDPFLSLSKIVPLEKLDLQLNLDEISTVSRWNPGRLAVWSTGGSTGNPTRLYIDLHTRDRRQAVQFRNAEWLGVHPGDRIAIFGGSSLGIGNGESRRAAVKALAKRRLLLGAWKLDPDTLDSYCDRLEVFKPQLLVGYSSALHQLADHMVRTKQLIDIPAVLSTAEMLLPKWAETIEQAFNSPAHNRYGSIEVGDIAHSCADCGEMHINEENVILEREEATGDLLVTDLTTFATPMLRYRIGDQVKFRPGPAPCGRALGTLVEIQGRSGDILELPNGQRVSSMVFAFTPGDTEGVRAYQVWQPDLTRLQVLIVSDCDEPAFQVLRELSGQFPNVHIEVMRVPSIQRLPSGKRPHLVKGKGFSGPILGRVGTQ